MTLKDFSLQFAVRKPFTGYILSVGRQKQVTFVSGYQKPSSVLKKNAFSGPWARYRQRLAYSVSILTTPFCGESYEEVVCAGRRCEGPSGERGG